ncbi:MAG: hypothetical protein J7513_13610 [Solirubrobacteraceae bacterium]|nr:hypothetical protein [Solirubrobacteraceae bacterium]
MVGGFTWWLVALLPVLLVLLWWRQVALSVVLICGVYGAAQHGLVEIQAPGMPATVQQGIAERQAAARERTRRYACERRAVAALSRDDGKALARVHRECGDVFTGDPVADPE